MRDFIDVGSSPPGETCAQVGSDGYHDLARKECRAYIAQLRRVFGSEPEGAGLTVKSNPHDFGTYLSVICYYDERFAQRPRGDTAPRSTRPARRLRGTDHAE
jgi:hypothetical protein